jgi:hypothetical protein
VTAFHSNWTRPFSLHNPDAQYAIADYDLLATILSALEWQKHNGSIKMITDNTGALYYQYLGIACIWDLGIDTLLESTPDCAVKPLPFWAAGKIYALQSQNAPCAMIDTDFIIWQPLYKQLEHTTLAVIHREEINGMVYPPKTAFAMSKNYTFPEQWDWSALPCNTAFLYITDESFKRYYTEQSIAFMKHLEQSRNTTAEMVFAEQRLLAMCAVEKSMPITSLLDVHNLENQRAFTHVWGFKNELRMNPQTRASFCKNCIKRILADFPEYHDTISRITQLKPYMPEV